MKTANKIILINTGIAVFWTIIGIIGTGGVHYNTGAETAFAFGIACLLWGVATIFVGFILLFSKKTEWRQGFFLSGAVLLLLSGISCGGGAMI